MPVQKSYAKVHRIFERPVFRMSFLKDRIDEMHAVCMIRRQLACLMNFVTSLTADPTLINCMFHIKKLLPSVRSHGTRAMIMVNLA